MQGNKSTSGNTAAEIINTAPSLFLHDVTETELKRVVITRAAALLHIENKLFYFKIITPQKLDRYRMLFKCRNFKCNAEIISNKSVVCRYKVSKIRFLSLPAGNFLNCCL